MKFSCQNVDLLPALQLTSRAIGNQQALPILGNILLEARGDACTLSATDLELSIITSIPAKIESEGSITIPAKAIVNFSQYNPDPEVLFETSQGTQLLCVSRHAKTTMAGEVSSEYPTITGIEKQTSFSLDAGPLLRALHLVTFASARTTLRPVLSGVYFRRQGGEITLVATDSFRLSEYQMVAAGGEVDEEISYIIPTKILEELKAILSGGKTEKKVGSRERVSTVQVALGKQQVEIVVDSTRLLSRLIDGKFPDYQQILPKETKTRVAFSARELVTTVKRMHYFAKEMNSTLTFHLNKNHVRISTPQTQIGRDEAEMSAEAEGEGGKIALSSSYLLDFLTHIDGEVMEMQMTDGMHPAVFRIPEEPRYLHLIMPLRMQEE